MSMVAGRPWCVAGLALAIGMTLPALARAEEPSEKSGASAKEEEKEEEKVQIGLDLVLGWGKVPFAVENPPAGGAPGPTYTRQDDVHSNVQSLILDGSIEAFEHVGFGARVPFTFAGFSPDGSSGRGAQSFGNVELEGEYGRELISGLKLFGALGVAVPTATGDEIPDTLLNTSDVNVDAPSYDRFSLSRAAASARGYEDNALFEPHRLGLIPMSASGTSFTATSRSR
jgi:hypothetical protein